MRRAGGRAELKLNRFCAVRLGSLSALTRIALECARTRMARLLYRGSQKQAWHGQRSALWLFFTGSRSGAGPQLTAQGARSVVHAGTRYGRTALYCTALHLRHSDSALLSVAGRRRHRFLCCESRSSLLRRSTSVAAPRLPSCGKRYVALALMSPWRSKECAATAQLNDTRTFVADERCRRDAEMDDLRERCLGDHGIVSRAEVLL
jgi:hypothetical protein